MDALLNAVTDAQHLLPLAGTILLVVLGLAVAQAILQRVGRTMTNQRFRNQIVMSALGFGGLILVVLALPVSETTRGQLLSLIGILLSAAIALSSTTLLGNAMAGIMLRAVRNFRTGDFVRCEGYAGRVSERGLFHTEIQNPDRELTTIPNLFLVTHPVTVVRSSGTIIATRVGLGYDVPRQQVETALLDAATRCGLEDAFVHVVELGDFAVTYRVAGLLKDTKTLISSESALRAATLDALHEAGVEIVSPNFMNTRAIAPEQRFVPPTPRRAAATVDDAPRVDDLVFDKAEEAEDREQLIEKLAQVEQAIADTREAARAAKDADAQRELERRVERLEATRTRLQERIALEDGDAPATS